MDKHPFIHDLTDDAALGIGVAGLTVLTGGLGDVAVAGAEGAEAATATAESAAADDTAVSTAEKSASKADDAGEDGGPEPEPEKPAGGRQSFALNPASVGDAGASAESTAGAGNILSGEAQTANLRAAKSAIQDAGKQIGDRAATALQDTGKQIGDRARDHCTASYKAHQLTNT